MVFHLAPEKLARMQRRHMQLHRVAESLGPAHFFVRIGFHQPPQHRLRLARTARACAEPLGALGLRPDRRVEHLQRRAQLGERLGKSLDRERLRPG